MKLKIENLKHHMDMMLQEYNLMTHETVRREFEGGLAIVLDKSFFKLEANGFTVNTSLGYFQFIRNVGKILAEVE